MKLSNAVYFRFGIFFIVIAVVSGLSLMWWQDSVSPVDQKNTSPIMFTITKGDGVKTIAANLSKNSLIRSPLAFFMLVKITGIERQLQAGEYRLSQSMNATQISRELTHGVSDVWITTLEGWRSEEIASKLSKEFDIPESEFMKYSVEGYMFPDTYMIPKDATAGAIVQIFVDNFHKKVPEISITKSMPVSLKPDEIIILASIVEREGHTNEDRPVIAGILLNRLAIHMPLQVDATLQYILGYDAIEKTWWRKTLTDSDKKINSPYNTYMNVGLPPKPIANPGLSAIQAVFHPVKSKYFYYLHDLSGQVHYAETIDKHNENIAQYLSY